MKKIKAVCRRKRYKLYATHPMWFLGGKYSKKCDVYIETANEIFAVKLFGVTRRRAILNFNENGQYFIKNFIAVFSYGSPLLFPINGKLKTLPRYDFRYKYADEWEIKTPRRILLVNPVSMEIRRCTKNGNVSIVGAGDIVNGMEVTSLPRLLEELENAL